MPLGAPVATATEDIANARIRFENGCVATITASRISLRTERRMRLFSQEGYMAVDFAERKLIMIGRDRGVPLPGTGIGRMEEITWDEQDALAAEHAAFVASVLDRAPVVVDAAAGRRALAAALAVEASMAAVSSPAGGGIRADHRLDRRGNSKGGHPMKQPNRISALPFGEQVSRTATA